MAAKGAYHKSACTTCGKVTWHYTVHGVTRCCIHDGNLAKPTASAVPDVVPFISADDAPKTLDHSRDEVLPKGKKSDKVYTPGTCPKGFHQASCLVCGKDTLHYKDETPYPAACTVCTKQGNAEFVARRKALGETVSVTNVIDPNAPKPPTDGEFRRLNQLDRSMWRSAEERTSHVHVPDDMEWAFDLSGFASDKPTAPKDPDKYYCTFCGRETPYLQLLKETKPKVKKVVNHYRNGAGDLITEEKVITSVERIQACPDCSLNVRKPIPVRFV